VYYLATCDLGALARVCLADVAGHGEEVAMVSGWLHGALRRHMNQREPNRVFETVNRWATRYGFEAITTAVCLSYIAPRGQLRYCYAGHPPALAMHPGESEWQPLELGDTRGPFANIPFGVSSSARYGANTITLAPGGRLFIYSDGVTETPGADGEQFGEGRLQSALNGARDLPIQAAAEAVRMALMDHAQCEDPSHDDVTFILLEALEYPPAPDIWRLLHYQTRRVRRLLGAGSANVS
jgi:serine phosphatase RsbU (regulator of sigma subunit)